MSRRQVAAQHVQCSRSVLASGRGCYPAVMMHTGQLAWMALRRNRAELFRSPEWRTFVARFDSCYHLLVLVRVVWSCLRKPALFPPMPVSMTDLKRSDSGIRVTWWRRLFVLSNGWLWPCSTSIRHAPVIQCGSRKDETVRKVGTRLQHPERIQACPAAAATLYGSGRNTRTPSSRCSSSGRQDFQANYLLIRLGVFWASFDSPKSVRLAGPSLSLSTCHM